MIGRVPVSLSNNGLVNAALAAQDAIDALDALALDGTDWRYQFEFSPTINSTRGLVNQSARHRMSISCDGR